MKLQIKYFEQSNFNFRQNFNNFIVFIFFLQWDFHIIPIETRNCLLLTPPLFSTNTSLQTPNNVNYVPKPSYTSIIASSCKLFTILLLLLSSLHLTNAILFSMLYHPRSSKNYEKISNRKAQLVSKSDISTLSTEYIHKLHWLLASKEPLLN